MFSSTGDEAALSGVRVLDLSLQLPGPYATMLLHALGAEIVKVEPPGGDPARLIDPPMFEKVNAGKATREVDLRTAEGRAELHALAATCDVLIEGFRPGVAERLGFGYDEIVSIRPDLVYCSISGYGQTGPYRTLPGHDLNYLGVAGAAGSHDRGGGAKEQDVPMVDLATGTSAALAIVAAVRRRDRTGEGCYLDVAMLDSAVAWANVKVPPETDAAEPAYAVLPASDGRRLSIGVIEDKFWRALCEGLGWDEWGRDATLATYEGRRARAAEVHERLAATIATRPRAEWLEVLEAVDVPVAPVHDRDEAPQDPQVRERDLLGDGRIRAPLPAAVMARRSGVA
jgi:crotonobetainyl-CoA:carnitine CoA-transferase CaiB-like acyl-CoA transferase